MGAGDMKKLVEQLLEYSVSEELIVVCGSNAKMENQLKKLFTGKERLTILGYTTQMTLYMKACDVLFTKPGGLTSTEGAAVGLPMVHTDPIPGCETANRKFFCKLGMSLSARTVKGQVNAGLKLLLDPEAASKMVKKQRENIDPDAAEKICQFIRKKI